MELAEAKERLKALNLGLPWTVFHTFERNGRALHLALTERLRKAARKEKLWGSNEMLITLKNASYGFDPGGARSGGGRDGIFVLDRDFRPENTMMHKVFSRFLDHPHSEADDIARALGVKRSELQAVRLVSHHLRLLGVLAQLPDADWLVLVDCDRDKD